MLKDLRPGKIYIATGYTDLRKGIDGLAGLIQEQFHLDVFEDTLFCMSRGERLRQRAICGSTEQESMQSILSSCMNTNLGEAVASLRIS